MWPRLCQVWSQSTDLFLTYSGFTADSLCYTVTLTFDHLALNIQNEGSSELNVVKNGGQILLFWPACKN